MKDISYERLEKLTSKINKSIQLQDIGLFKKWYAYVEKETKPGVFKEIFANEAVNFINKNNHEFFDILIDKGHVYFSADNWKRIFNRIFEHQSYRSYDIVEKHIKERMYTLPFFKENIIYKFYIYKFNYKFDDLLSRQEPEHKFGYFNVLHLNGLQDLKMTETLYQTLTPEEKKSALENNLKSLISDKNNLQDIAYFFHKLHNDFEIDKTTQQTILVHGLLRFKDVSSLNKYEKNRFIKSELQKDVLSYPQEELGSGGKMYADLLGKYILNKSLHETLENKNYTKKQKL